MAEFPLVNPPFRFLFLGGNRSDWRDKLRHNRGLLSAAVRPLARYTAVAVHDCQGATDRRFTNLSRIGKFAGGSLVQCFRQTDREATELPCERNRCWAQRMTVRQPQGTIRTAAQQRASGRGANAAGISQELIQAVQHADIREVLEARVFETTVIPDRVDRCFKLIGEEPLKTSGRLEDVLVRGSPETSRLGIRSPLARRLYAFCLEADAPGSPPRSGEWIAVVRRCRHRPAIAEFGLTH